MSEPTIYTQVKERLKQEMNAMPFLQDWTDEKREEFISEVHNDFLESTDYLEGQYDALPVKKYVELFAEFAYQAMEDEVVQLARELNEAMKKEIMLKMADTFRHFHDIGTVVYGNLNPSDKEIRQTVSPTLAEIREKVVKNATDKKQSEMQRRGGDKLKFN